MEETSNVPKLRFKEFTEPWEEILLKDNAYIKGRIGWKNLKQSEYTIKGPYLIASKHINNGKIYWEKCDHLSNKRYLESPEIALKLGDVIFSKDGSLGNPALIKYLPHESTINGTMMLVRVNSNISPNFFYQVLNSDYFFRLLHVLKSGSSIPHIFQRDMNNFKFKIPIKIKEQEMIADFLELIDNKINLLSSTIEYLKDFKNYCLQNLFSENKLRFKEFIDDWIKIKLGNLVKIYSGKSPKNLIKDKGKFPYFKVEQLNDCSKFLKITPYLINDSSLLIKKGSVIFPKRGMAIMSNKIRILNQNSFMDTNLMALTVNEKMMNNEFLFYLLINERLSRIADMTSIPQLNNKHINPYLIYLPSLKEQEKIANFLSSIDKKIDLTQNQIDLMENFKKGLLQEMFV